jgi:hypothetical protein
VHDAVSVELEKMLPLIMGKNTKERLEILRRFK